MPTNTNFNPQGTAQVTGGYAQPSPGVTEAVVTVADPAGNALATELASGGTAILETGNYRDSIPTVQVTTSVTSAAGAAVIATVTPGTAGIWEVIGDVAISGTTVAATDTNNMALYQTGAQKMVIPVIVPSTTGSTVAWPYGPVTLNLSGADTVNIKAVAGATTNAVYTANIIARRVG